MTQKEFKLLYTIKKHGMKSYRELSELSGVSTGYISQTLTSFRKQGLVDDAGITDAGLDELAPYKVNNAIIMAAGMSSRFMPISLEKPKGMLVVKDEVLIERQINQLRAAGIREIILVLGYKKEAFFYLEEKMDVKILINPLYNVKNNIETVYLAQQYIGNSYICSSDNYFSENVFEEYVYQSYYASIHVQEKTNEWYMTPDDHFNISKVNKSGEAGYIMLGHVYWDRSFAKAFLELVNRHHDTGDYDHCLWEDLFIDHIRCLPPMKIKVYPQDVIHEFDSLDELREFDASYMHNSHSRIMDNICGVFHCEETDILNFVPIKKGLTNTSFVFEVKGKNYVYRHPGENTEQIISRKHEKTSITKAKQLGIDPTFIAMNEEEGWKISHYVPNFRVPDYADFEDSKRVIEVMRKLHDSRENVSWDFSPWEEALKIETLLREKGDIQVTDFDALKHMVEHCYKLTSEDGVEKCLCHCDTYAPNWMITPDATILIDWEYSGNADPGCDVGGYIMDAMYDVNEAKKFIRYYCGDACDDSLLTHYLAYVAIISYYWFVWALYRESCGAVMGDSLHNWYVMAKRFSKYVSENTKESYNGK